jgi:hypothetical protein
MQTNKTLTMLLAATLLAGCGGGSDSRSSGGTPAATTAAATARSGAKSGNATAEEVAREARGKVKCPPRIETKAPAGAPVDDIVGVRPGMTWDEAVNAVLCSDEMLVVTPETRRGYTIQTYGQALRQGFNARYAEPRVQKSSKEILAEMQDAAMARGTNRVVRDVKPGQTKWYVGTMGLPEQERVISAAREQWFETGRLPTLASVRDALQEKYGTPTIVEDFRDHGLQIVWARDASGQPTQRCRAPADPDLGVTMNADCGITVAARIQPSRENPALAEFLQVTTVDQARGYALLEGTERMLQAADAERRAREVEAAANTATKPVL